MASKQARDKAAPGRHHDNSIIFSAKLQHNSSSACFVFCSTWFDAASRAGQKVKGAKMRPSQEDSGETFSRAPVIRENKSSGGGMTMKAEAGCKGD